AGSLQPAIRLFTYTGIAKIGAARSYALRASAPLFSAVLAIIFLGEQTTLPIVAGTLAIVAGIFLTSWESGGKPVLWLDLALPVFAALLAGIAQPIRRQALSLANEPLFFAAIVGAISLVWYVLYLALPGTEKPVWNRKSLVPFVSAGLFETLGIWPSIVALSQGTGVVVTPLLSTSPVWVLIISSIFLRHVERITWKITLGTLGVVAGTIIIALGRRAWSAPLDQFLQTPHLARRLKMLPGDRPRYFADVKIAARVEREAVRRDELPRRLAWADVAQARENFSLLRENAEARPEIRAVLVDRHAWPELSEVAERLAPGIHI